MSLQTAKHGTIFEWQHSLLASIHMSISNAHTAQNTHKMKECNTADLVKAHSAAINTCIQCESKKSPLRFSDIFSQTDGNFLINFYTPIIRSVLHRFPKKTNM